MQFIIVSPFTNDEKYNDYNINILKSFLSDDKKIKIITDKIYLLNKNNKYHLNIHEIISNINIYKIKNEKENNKSLKDYYNGIIDIDEYLEFFKIIDSKFFSCFNSYYFNKCQIINYINKDLILQISKI